MNNYFDFIECLIKENKWLQQFFQSQNCCVICFHSDPFDLEEHHVGAKNNSNFTISLCRNCHGKVSRKQYKWPKEWPKKNKPSKKKTACLLIGLSDVIREIGEKMYYES